MANRKIAAYKTIAIALAVVGLSAIVAAITAYGIGLGGPLSSSSTDWGTFGDFVGGIAGTVIALSTLIALVVTLHLQAKELEETREALRDQADAAKMQATYAKEQYLRTAIYEERRVQPFLKTEWHTNASQCTIHWRIRNAGLGPCILDSLTLRCQGSEVGTHAFDAPGEARNVWDEGLTRAYTSNQQFAGDIHFHSIHTLKRVLDVRESQELFYMYTGQNDPLVLRKEIEWLDQILDVNISFRSVAGLAIDTDHQYDDNVRESNIRDLIFGGRPPLDLN